MGDSHPLLSIGELCYVTDGAHARVQRQTHGILYLTSKNIGLGRLFLGDVDYISEEDYEHLFSDSPRAQRRPRAGDVLMGIIGTFGNAYLYRKDDRFGISSAVALLRPDQSRLSPQFLYYVLISPMFRAAHDSYKAGSVQGYTNIPTIKRLPVPTPPLEEQRAIAHILGTFDDKIELNRQMNETLEAMARALFKSWFVDFDPVRAKAAGRQPAGMDAATAKLFPDAFEMSELGEIPRGWRVLPVGEIAAVVGGTTPSTACPEYWTNGTHYWATPKDFSALQFPVLLSTERMITDSGLAQIGSGLLPVGSVLLSSRAPIGYLAITEVSVSINQGFIGMLPKPGISNLFILRWTESSLGEIMSRANGSTFLEISKSSFRPIPVICPSDRVMLSFDNTARDLHKRVVSNLKETVTLSKLRDTLLPPLLSGELSIPDAERFVGRAV